MWHARDVEQLASLRQWTYSAGAASASEPAAWSALALAANGRFDAALKAASWLAAIQQDCGAVGVTADQLAPRWPTSLAILAWNAVDRLAAATLFKKQIDAATRWLLDSMGKPSERRPQIGHDTTLVGWSWAADTHSWLEPTCLAVLALRSVGRADHPRTREGVRLIVDRLLPSGGANYGNTFVLGQQLLPHLQPSGLATAALAGEEKTDPRIEATLQYLTEAVQSRTGIASLCYGLLGLTACRRRPENADELIAECLADDLSGSTSAHELALTLLAGRADVAWLPVENKPRVAAAATARRVSGGAHVDVAPERTASRELAASSAL